MHVFDTCMQANHAAYIVGHKVPAVNLRICIYNCLDKSIEYCIQKTMYYYQKLALILVFLYVTLWRWNRKGVVKEKSKTREW